jgi:hypothetical protein
VLDLFFFRDLGKIGTLLRMYLKRSISFYLKLHLHHGLSIVVPGLSSKILFTTESLVYSSAGNEGTVPPLERL